MTQGEATMKLWMHVVLALLQFLMAYTGVIGFLSIGGVFGFVEPLWWGGKALFAPMFSLEGLGLAMVPSYALAFRIFKFEWGWGAMLRVLCLGFVQGILFPLIAFGMIWVGLLGWSNDEVGTDVFWWFLAILLALAAIASSVISALLVRMLLKKLERKVRGQV